MGTATERQYMLQEKTVIWPQLFPIAWLPGLFFSDQSTSLLPLTSLKTAANDIVLNVNILHRIYYNINVWPALFASIQEPSRDTS
jgi:fumarate reductase subunit C